MANVKLSVRSLKQYIAAVCQLEQMKYLQEQAIAKVEEEIRRLSGSYPGPQPVMPEEIDRGTDSGTSLFGGIIVIILGFVIGSMNAAILLLGVPMVIIGFVMVFSTGDCKEKNKNADEANKRAKQRYQEDMEKYRKSVQRSEADHLYAAYLSRMLPGMKSTLNNIQRDLDRAYSYNIIYHKYRSLIAVTSFYDYLHANKCNSLEGPYGAYNIFDHESRLDKIIVRLDKILEKLDELKYNQYALYSLMKDANQKLSQIDDSINQSRKALNRISDQAEVTNEHLKKISVNAELIRFSADQVRREQELRNRVQGIVSSYYI